MCVGSLLGKKKCKAHEKASKLLVAPLYSLFLQAELCVALHLRPSFQPGEHVSANREEAYAMSGGKNSNDQSKSCTTKIIPSSPKKYHPYTLGLPTRAKHKVDPTVFDSQQPANQHSFAVIHARNRLEVETKLSYSVSSSATQMLAA